MCIQAKLGPAGSVRGLTSTSEPTLVSGELGFCVSVSGSHSAMGSLGEEGGE